MAACSPVNGTNGSDTDFRNVPTGVGALFYEGRIALFEDLGVLADSLEASLEVIELTKAIAYAEGMLNPKAHAVADKSSSDGHLLLCVLLGGNVEVVGEEARGAMAFAHNLEVRLSLDPLLELPGPIDRDIAAAREEDILVLKDDGGN